MADGSDAARKDRDARNIAPMVGIVIGILLVVGLLLVYLLLDWYIEPETASDRTALAEIIGTVLSALLIGGLLSAFFAFRQQKLSEAEHSLRAEQHIADLFMNAVAQLGATNSDGSPRIETRVGGINSLQSIAPFFDRGFLSDVGPGYIVDTMAAYVRQNALVDTSDTGLGNGKPAPPREDVQAAMNVISDLWSNTAIRVGRDLHLRRTDLRRMHLDDAVLDGVRLRDANLAWIHLEGAHLKGANFVDADLTHARLKGADLRGADMRRATFTNAKLEMALLQGADLRLAKGHTTKQIREAQVDHTTEFEQAL